MRALRLVKELKDLGADPPHGTAVWADDIEDKTRLNVKMTGPENTPYSKGIFRLTVSLPERYPFEPPSVRFTTKVFHPNIDNEGRICLDSLKMPPKGSWNPSMNISQVLQQIRMLLQEPNPEDPLMPDITNLYITSRSSFNERALQWTELYAVEDSSELAGKKRKTDESEEVTNENAEAGSNKKSKNH